MLGYFQPERGREQCFLCLFLGNLEIPVPEEVVLLAGGFLAGRHLLKLDRLYVVAILSAIGGDARLRLCGDVTNKTRPSEQ